MQVRRGGLRSAWLEAYAGIYYHSPKNPGMTGSNLVTAFNKV